MAYTGAHAPAGVVAFSPVVVCVVQRCCLAWSTWCSCLETMCVRSGLCPRTCSSLAKAKSLYVALVDSALL